MFKSILNKSALTNGMILSGAVNFSLDINTVEQHASKLRPTANPVQQGANIADHVLLEPKEITITGIVVGYEPVNFSIENFTGYHFSEYPLPMSIKTVTAQAENRVNQFAAYYQTGEKVMNQIIADFLPTYQAPRLNNVSADRIADAYSQLLAIQRSGEPVTLQTNLRQYKNMLLTSVGLTQQKKSAAEFVLTFGEIFIVQTKTASGLKVKSKNLGKTQPVKVMTRAKKK
ncbi:hypothetical protein PT273_06300 [Orbaceae bacterium ESL0727]|nr:hypothetical protein [Orbaceae bacterium ESL0727]